MTVFPRNSILMYCNVCGCVTSHDARSEPPTCHICAVRLIVSVTEDEEGEGE